MALTDTDEGLVVELGLRILYMEIVGTFIEKGDSSNPLIKQLMRYVSATGADVNAFVLGFAVLTTAGDNKDFKVDYDPTAFAPGTAPQQYLSEVYEKYDMSPPKDGFMDLISERENWHDTKTARNGNYYVYLKEFFVDKSEIAPTIKAGKDNKFDLQKNLPAMMSDTGFMDFVKDEAIKQYIKDNPDTQIDFEALGAAGRDFILILGKNGYSFHLKQRPDPKKSQFFVRVFLNDHGIKLASGIVDLGGADADAEQTPKGALLPEGIKKDFLVKNFLNGLETVIKASGEVKDDISDETKKMYDSLVPLKKAFTAMAKKNKLSENSTVSFYFNSGEPQSSGAKGEKFKFISILDADTNHILKHKPLEDILKSNVALNEKVIMVLNKLSCEFGDSASIDLEPSGKEPEEEEEESYFESGDPPDERTWFGPEGQHGGESAGVAGTSLSTAAADKKRKDKEKKKKGEKEKSKKSDIATSQAAKKTSGGSYDAYGDVLNPLNIKKAAKKTYREKTKKMSNKNARLTLLEAFIDNLDMTEIMDCFLDAAPGFDAAVLGSEVKALYGTAYSEARKHDPQTFPGIFASTGAPSVDDLFAIVTPYQYKRIFSTIITNVPGWRNKPGDLFQDMVTIKKRPDFKTENFIPLMIKKALKEYVKGLAAVSTGKDGNPDKEATRKFNNFYSEIAKKNIKLQKIVEKEGDNKTDKEKIKASNKSKKEGSDPPTMDWKMASGLILNFWAIASVLMKTQIDEQKDKLLSQMIGPIINSLQNDLSGGDPDDVERMDRVTAAIASSNDLVENALESTGENNFVNKVDFIKAIQKDVFPSNSYKDVVCLFDTIANDIDFGVQVKLLSGNISLENPQVTLLKYILEDCDLPSDNSTITKLFIILGGYIDNDVIDKKIEHISQIKNDYFEICEDNEELYIDNLREFLDEDSANSQAKNVSEAAARQLKNLFGMIDGTALEDAAPNMFCQQGLDNKKPLMPNHYHEVSINQQNKLMKTVIKSISSSFNSDISQFKPMILKDINLSLFQGNGTQNFEDKIAQMITQQVAMAAAGGKYPENYLRNLWMDKIISKLGQSTFGMEKTFAKDDDGKDNLDYFWYRTQATSGINTYIVFNFTDDTQAFDPVELGNLPGEDNPQNQGVKLKIKKATLGYAIINPQSSLLSRRFISPAAASGPGVQDLILWTLHLQDEETNLLDIEAAMTQTLIGTGTGASPTNSIFANNAVMLEMPEGGHFSGLNSQNPYNKAIFAAFTNNMGNDGLPSTGAKLKDNVLMNIMETLYNKVFATFINNYNYFNAAAFSGPVGPLKDQGSIAFTDEEFSGDGGLLCAPEIELEFKDYRDSLQCHMEIDQRPDSYQLAHMFVLYQMLINVFLLQEMLKNIFLIFEMDDFNTGSKYPNYKIKDFILSSFSNLFNKNIIQVGTLSQNFAADLKLLYKYESFKNANTNPPTFVPMSPSALINNQSAGQPPIPPVAGFNTPQWPDFKSFEEASAKIKEPPKFVPSDPDPNAEEKAANYKKSQEWEIDLCLKYFSWKYYDKILEKLKERVMKSIEGWSAAKTLISKSDGPTLSVPWIGTEDTDGVVGNKLLEMAEGDVSKVSGWVYQQYIDIRQRIDYGTEQGIDAGVYVPKKNMHFWAYGSPSVKAADYHETLKETLKLLDEDADEEIVETVTDLFEELFSKEYDEKWKLTDPDHVAAELLQVRLQSPGLTDILQTGAIQFGKSRIMPHFKDITLGGLPLPVVLTGVPYGGSVLDKTKSARWCLQTAGWVSTTSIPAQETWKAFQAIETPAAAAKDFAANLVQAHDYMRIKHLPRKTNVQAGDMSQIDKPLMIDGDALAKAKKLASAIGSAGAYTYQRYYAGMIKNGLIVTADSRETINLNGNSLSEDPFLIWYTPLSYPGSTYQALIDSELTSQIPSPLRYQHAGLWSPNKGLWSDFILTQGKMSPVSFFRYYYIPYVLSMASGMTKLSADYGATAISAEKFSSPWEDVLDENEDVIADWSKNAKEGAEQFGKIFAPPVDVKWYKGWQATNDKLTKFGPDSYFSKVAVGTRACIAIPLKSNLQEPQMSLIKDILDNLKSSGLYEKTTTGPSNLADGVKEVLYEKMLDYWIQDQDDPTKEKQRILLIPVFQKEIDILKTENDSEILNTWSASGGAGNIAKEIFNKPVEMWEVLRKATTAPPIDEETGELILDGHDYNKWKEAEWALKNYDWLGEMLETVRLQYFWMSNQNWQGSTSSLKAILKGDVDNALGNINFERLVAESIRALTEEIYAGDLEQLFDQTKQNLLEAIYSLKASIDGDWRYEPKAEEGSILPQVMSLLQPLVKVLVKVLPIPGL